MHSPLYEITPAYPVEPEIILPMLFVIRTIEVTADAVVPAAVFSK
jgi:hypothetical protein